MDAKEEILDDPQDDVVDPSESQKVVSEFMVALARAIRDQDMTTLDSLYEVRFNAITDRYFKAQVWPAFDFVAPLVSNDDLLMTLYRELYYRHIYAKLTPTIHDRIASWENYQHLFQVIIDTPLPLVLPIHWLWDMIDEFIYQFQTFHQYRPKLKQRTEEEICLLKAHPQLWDLPIVLDILQRLMQRSNIVVMLRDQGEKSLLPSPGKVANADLLRRQLGYFAIIELVRVQCLLGDYTTALTTLSSINIQAKGLYLRVPACHSAVCYYMGFSFMMLRRYLDAIRTFQGILRTRLYHTRSYQYDTLVKKNEQMYALLALCLALYPQRIDENLQAVLRERLADKISRLQRGDESAFEEMFGFACPKFINPAQPNYDDLQANTTLDAHKLQAKSFMKEIKEQLQLAAVRSYLKLYTSIAVPKLARFLDVDEPKCREMLAMLKDKSKMLVYDPAVHSSITEGHPVLLWDIDFTVDGDTVKVEPPRAPRGQHEYFLRQVRKLQTLQANVSRLDVLPPAAPAPAPVPTS
eukprot:GAFH01001156.1.p1 GENE.GAFH01001156.1~~GAFH01001156.1.p1  ORF type:complete len:532 (-),score=214.31 GAFH01001156.1:295-1863(-)